MHCATHIKNNSITCYSNETLNNIIININKFNKKNITETSNTKNVKVKVDENKNDKPATETPATEKTAIETPATEKSDTETAATENPVAESPAGITNTSYATNSTANETPVAKIEEKSSLRRKLKNYRMH